MHRLLTKVQYYLYVFAKLKDVYFFLNFAFLCTERGNNMKSLTPERDESSFWKKKKTRFNWFNLDHFK